MAGRGKARRIFEPKHCAYCGVEFQRGTKEGTRDYIVRRYCSKKCGHANRGNIQRTYNLTPEGRERLSTKTRERVRKLWTTDPEYRQRIVALLSRARLDPEIRDKRLRKMRATLSSPEFRQAHSGERSVSWRGGLTSANGRIRGSLEYRRWKKAVLQRDGHICVLCGVNKAEDKTIVLHVDHIKPFALFPDLRFDVDNGRVLCKQCHLATDTYGSRAKLRKAA